MSYALFLNSVEKKITSIEKYNSLIEIEKTGKIS